MALPIEEDYEPADDWDEERCRECGWKNKHCSCWDDDFTDDVMEGMDD